MDHASHIFNQYHDNWLVILISITFVISILLVWLRPPRYERINYLLTNAEKKYFYSLRTALGEDYAIFVKVRIADILQPKHRFIKRSWWKAFTKISSKHVDFVLCDPTTFSILAAIELDDRSHLTKQRINRDTFVNKIFNGADLPLIRFKVKNKYQPEDIRRQITDIISRR